MNAKVCGHHCVFVCSPNLGARVPLRGENLYGVRERVDVRLLLGSSYYYGSHSWKSFVLPFRRLPNERKLFTKYFKKGNVA